MTDLSGKIIAYKVPEEERGEFLPKNFGISLMLQAESMIFDFMKKNIPDYTGGYYEFYKLSNGGFYMAINDESVNIKTYNLNDTISGDAAGIIATIFTIGSLLFEDNLDIIFNFNKLNKNPINFESLQNNYYNLLDYAYEHPEWEKIQKIID